MFGKNVRSGGTVDHNGMDVAGELNSPVFAAHGGTVVKAYGGVPANQEGSRRNKLGNYVKIESVANGQTFTLTYGHLNDVFVTDGMSVRTGEVIGLLGKTGNAYGTEIIPHVHIKAEQNGQVVDPQLFLSTQFDSNGNVTSRCNQ
jgi:murein DD-endopeptidase MepM/ murein hydrolase activator NlpD